MIAKKIPTTLTLHGIERTDEYAWMKNVKDPDLIPLLEFENQQTDKKLEHTKPLQEKIYAEIVSRILEDDQEHPYAMGDYEYFHRMQKGKNYAQYFRKKMELSSFFWI
jgi:oligopeptidase B